MPAEITLRKYLKGATIVAMGGQATALYIVVRGQVGISRGAEPDATPYSVLGPGSIFGESAMLVGQRYMGYARALSDAVCVVVPQEKLPDLGDTLI